MKQRWLVIFKLPGGAPAAKIIDDDGMNFPFGVDDALVDRRCWEIIAIVGMPDDYAPDEIVVRDRVGNDICVQVEGSAE